MRSCARVSSWATWAGSRDMYDTASLSCTFSSGELILSFLAFSKCEPSTPGRGSSSKLRPLMCRGSVSMSKLCLSIVCSGSSLINCWRRSEAYFPSFVWRPVIFFNSGRAFDIVLEKPKHQANYENICYRKLNLTQVISAVQLKKR